MTRDKIIQVASQEIGTCEKPSNSNKTKYGKWFGLDGLAWCGMFVSWCFAQAELPLGNIGFLKGFAGCQTAVAYFKKNNCIVTIPKAGDIVFFDFNKDGRYDHTGIFVRQIDRNHFESIEGNTSTSNQSNGGCVMKRIRSYTGVLFARPECLTNL